MNDDDDPSSARAVLEPIVRTVVDALGGYEGNVYRMGDDAAACLRDLKRLWRLDDDDDDRTVARIFWDTRVLPNDLVPILLATAGAGHVEDKRAIACADLVTAMTWPIDIAEELRELDAVVADYTQLSLSHLHYKAALLAPGVFRAIFALVLPPLAKPVRTERDDQIVRLVFHLVRNLAFIKDLPPNMHASADQAAFASLQSSLVLVLSQTHTLDLLLTLASNTDANPLFTACNTLVLEILFLLFRGVPPAALADKPAQRLHTLLAAEDRHKRDAARHASSRHSRFGTTIAVQRPSAPLVLHRQAALTHDTGAVLDMAKNPRARKPHTLDALARTDVLSPEARLVLHGFARAFVQSCFNPFFAALLRDVQSDKITEKDHLRLLATSQWLLAFYLDQPRAETWTLGLIAEVTDRRWIAWVLSRTRTALAEKPRMWTELQAGLGCLVQLLRVIDRMTPAHDDAADLLCQQLVYHGDVLDLAREALRAYRDGTQSLAYLDVSVHLAYALLRMLEHWGRARGNAAYVRKKKVRKERGDQEGEGDPAEEEAKETMFTLQAFELTFAQPDVTRTLLAYLARYKTLDADAMKRLVSLIHRQVVNAQAPSLYFQVSTMQLFHAILEDRRTLPSAQPYRDLVQLITFVLRQLFKSIEHAPFGIIEAWYPVHRKRAGRVDGAGRRANLGGGSDDESGSGSDEGGSEVVDAVRALVARGETALVLWVKDILVLAIQGRERGDGPYEVPYIEDAQAEAASRDEGLKRLLELVGCEARAGEGDQGEVTWTVPGFIGLSVLRVHLATIDRCLDPNADADAEDDDDSSDDDDDGNAGNRKKGHRKKKKKKSRTGSARRKKAAAEARTYTSAPLIEDSDGEPEEWAAFLERERLLREKTARAAAVESATREKPTKAKSQRRASSPVMVISSDDSEPGSPVVAQRRKGVVVLSDSDSEEA